MYRDVAVNLEHSKGQSSLGTDCSMASTRTVACAEDVADELVRNILKEMHILPPLCDMTIV